MEKIIDCRKCGNCDMENGCCKIYGSDPKKAVVECASKNFGAYRPNCDSNMYAKNTTKEVKPHEVSHPKR